MKLIPLVWYLAILMAFMFFGCFQAREEEYTSRPGREGDLVRANAEIDKWKERAQSLTREIAAVNNRGNNQASMNKAACPE